MCSNHIYVYIFFDITHLTGTSQFILLSKQDLHGAGMAVYGSRTTMILFNTQNKKVEELSLLRMGSSERWIVTKPDLRIKADAKLFAPAMKSAYEHPMYLKIFEEYCLKGYSIRYSGCYAVDCFQMFIKGHGVYSMLDSIAHPSRLHLIF